MLIINESQHTQKERETETSVFKFMLTFDQYFYAREYRVDVGWIGDLDNNKR